jgi:hypothetical protein
MPAVERGLPEAPDNVWANIFYSKLHKGVRTQTTGIVSLPNARIEMVSLAQQVWEDLRQGGRLSYRALSQQSRGHFRTEGPTKPGTGTSMLLARLPSGH